VLAGTVMANGYVTMGAGAELEGRVFSQSGYITLGSDVTLKTWFGTGLLEVLGVPHRTR
jgi:hypothetical protein